MNQVYDRLCTTLINRSKECNVCEKDIIKLSDTNIANNIESHISNEISKLLNGTRNCFQCGNCVCNGCYMYCDECKSPICEDCNMTKLWTELETVTVCNPCLDYKAATQLSVITVKK